MHFCVVPLCLLKHFDVIYDTVVHAIKQKNLDNFVIIFRGFISNNNQKLSPVYCEMHPESWMLNGPENHGAIMKKGLLCGRIELHDN